MHAHLADLRSELPPSLDPAAVERLLEAVGRDWRDAPLAPRERALCAFADKLTRAPSSMAAEDVEALRAHRLSDRAIHDAIQVVAYFNYVNRVADAVHVDLEPEMPPDPRRGATPAR